MVEQKPANSKPCGWCRGGSILDVGPGVFRDFDFDLSDGIPVCGGCGGLGIEYDDSAIQKRVDEISELRFVYCPMQSQPPIKSVRLKTLKLLAEKVTELYREFGDPSLDCFGKRIAEGALESRIRKFQEDIEEKERIIRSLTLEIEDVREAMIAIYVQGDMERAEMLFRQLTERYPASSHAAHDYGVFLIEMRGDYENALPWLERSTLLAPKIALHFLQMAKCLAHLGRHAEVDGYIHKAIACPDADRVPALREYLEAITSGDGKN